MAPPVPLHARGVPGSGLLLLVQINALRYQSDVIMWVQRAALALDLLALTWFFRRNRLDGSKWPVLRRLVIVRRWAGLLWWPAVVLVALHSDYDSFWRGAGSGSHFARLVGCEHPFDASGARFVSLSLPGCDFALEPIWVGDATIEALAAQDADLDLDQLSQLACLGV